MIRRCNAHKETLRFVAVLLAAAGGTCSTAAQHADSVAKGSYRKVVFVCDGGQSISVTVSDGTALLDANGASAHLAQQPAASGIHYAGSGHDLRGKGPKLTWTDSNNVIHQCREQKATPNEPQLAGTSWRLVHFRSSDDSIGTIVPPNVANYTLQFTNDHTLIMRLDCNRANAKWEAKPSSANGGSLAISPGAMTRAMCVPGAIDTRLAQDMARVRSYTVRDGRLSLALEADAGIYLWEPISE